MIILRAKCLFLYIAVTAVDITLPPRGALKTESQGPTSLWQTLRRGGKPEVRRGGNSICKSPTEAAPTLFPSLHSDPER